MLIIQFLLTLDNIKALAEEVGYSDCHCLPCSCMSAEGIFCETSVRIWFHESTLQPFTALLNRLALLCVAVCNVLQEQNYSADVHVMASHCAIAYLYWEMRCHARVRTPLRGRVTTAQRS